MKPKSNALPWLGVSALVVGLDQWTKWLAVSKLAYQQAVTVVPGFWNWTLAHNIGAAFSFLAHTGGWQPAFFINLAFVISAVLTVRLARTQRGDWRIALPLALIVGGALGNVIDRFRFGYVIDFIQWYWRDHYWPVFNLADSSIVVGVAWLALFGLATSKKTRR